MSLSAAYTFLRQAWPPAPSWSTDQIPDMSGKVVLITGANAGLGKETARVLLEKNAKVYVAARNADKAQQTLQELKEQTGREAHLLMLDLANLGKIKVAAEEFMSKETELHVLFNNAGLMAPPIDMVTDDGYDMQWGVHVLGHFYFTQLLLPILSSTAKDKPKGTVRVVNSSSVAHLFGKLNFDSFKDGPARRKIRPEELYAQSKMGNVVYATEFSRRYRKTGIVTTAIHPGIIKSEINRHTPALVTRIQDALFTKDVKLGALTQLYAGAAPGGADLDGQYLIPFARLGKPAPYSQDPELGQKLWSWLEDQVKGL